MESLLAFWGVFGVCAFLCTDEPEGVFRWGPIVWFVVLFKIIFTKLGD